MSKVTANFLEGLVDSTLKETPKRKYKKRRIQKITNGKKRVTFVAEAELWDKVLSYAYTTRSTITDVMSEMMSEYIEEKEKEVTLIRKPKTRRKRPLKSTD